MNFGIKERDSLLVIIDMQEKFFKVIPDFQKITSNIVKILKAANMLQIPVLLTEQYPKGLGNTVPEIKECLVPSCKVLSKTTFSIYKDSVIKETLHQFNKSTIIVAGIETHICILQSALDLIYTGIFKVFILEDAVGSRNIAYHKNAIERMKSSNIITTNIESVMFEWLESSTHPCFKEIQALIK